MVPSWPARRAASFTRLRSRIRRLAETKSENTHQDADRLETAPKRLLKVHERRLVGLAPSRSNTILIWGSRHGGAIMTVLAIFQFRMVATGQDAIRVYDGCAPTGDDSSTLVMAATRTTRCVVFGPVTIVPRVATSTLAFLKPERSASSRSLFSRRFRLPITWFG